MKGLSNTAVVIILLATSISLYAAYTMLYEPSRPLPVFGPLEDGVQHTVSPYQFTDQKGKLFNSATTAGQIVIFNSFFASCPTICPKMMTSMERIQKATQSSKDRVSLISMTVDPKRDTPERLGKYAPRYKVDYNRWKLITGDKKELYTVARKEYFLVATDGDGGPGDFIHSERLALVDQNGQIRGYYDGTDSDAVNELIRDLRRLLKN